MIYFTGDLHGEWDILKLKDKNTDFITSNDVLIIAGDFGLVWNLAGENQCKYWRDWLDKKRYPVLFCDGNHENFTRLLSDEFPEIDMFEDKVKQISKNIFELQTGHLYNIQDNKVFVFGGAMSVDRAQRTPYKTWWPEEIPSPEVFRNGLKTLRDNGNDVDIIVSHAAHRDAYLKALHLMPSIGEKENDPVVNMLQEIRATTSYKLWVNGHYHFNVFDGESKTAMLYNLIMSKERLENIVNEDKDTFCLKKL